MYPVEPFMKAEQRLPPEKKYTRGVLFHFLLKLIIDSFSLLLVESMSALLKQPVDQGIMIREEIISAPDL